ncbi:hypothetical protein, partial [Microtetraspora fusca]|uniref:hypothetical protein n=1 Tax=Microtetraspora fusca TaxID=1997 RepID=UPI001471004A
MTTDSATRRRRAVLRAGLVCAAGLVPAALGAATSTPAQAKQTAVAPPRIAVLKVDGAALVKEGGLS